MPGYEGGAGKLIFVLQQHLSSPGRGIRDMARLSCGAARGEVAEWLKAAPSKAPDSAAPSLEDARAWPVRPFSEDASAILRRSAEKWPSG